MTISIIDSLEVFNFQNHKHSYLEFHPGVNVIVGLSDAGKTALIRAFRWIIWNRPKVNDFRSRWGGETRAIIRIDKDTIERSQDKFNAYTLNKMEFRAIRSDVPEEIAKALNFNEINLSQQFDRPFLLDSSPGDVAQHFNRVAHLDIISTSSKRVQSWLRKIEQELEATKQQLEKEKTNLLQYENLELFETAVSQLERLERKHTQLLTDKTALQSCKSSCDLLCTEINKQNAIIHHESAVKAVYALITKRDLLTTKLEQFQTLVLNCTTAQQSITAYTHTIKLETQVSAVSSLIELRDAKKQKVKELAALLDACDDTQESIDKHEKTLKLEEQVKAVQKLIDTRNKKEEELGALRALRNNAFSTNGLINTQSKLLLQLEKDFETNFPDTCPLCGKTK